MSVDLSSRYLGLTLRSPLVAAASPATGELDNLKALADAGVGAVVLPSLFEEQIRHDEVQAQHLQEFATESFAEALDYLPDIQPYNTGPSGTLYLIEQAKQNLSVPVIGSLNGVTRGGWVKYARFMEEAGADAVELNMYILDTDTAIAGHDVDQRYLDLIEAVRAEISIPLALKIGPYFSAPAHMAKCIQQAGADGLVLFNRLMHPTIDLETLEPALQLAWSHSFESRLPVRWIAILRDQLSASLAATTGVHSHEDVLRLLLVGADAVMMASAILQRGISSVTATLDAMTAWLEEREYESIEQLKGSLSLKNCPDPGAYERANYMKSLTSFKSPWLG